MLVPATVSFDEVVIAIHIIAVLIGFGLVIAYPFITLVAGRIDQRALPALHRARQQLGRLIVNPALALVLVSGIYLASENHDWKQFFVQWGVAMVVILGGLEGAVVMRGEGKLAELSAAEVTAGGGSGSASGALSADYQRIRLRTDLVARVMAFLVLLTLVFMVFQTN